MDYRFTAKLDDKYYNVVFKANGNFTQSNKESKLTRNLKREHFHKKTFI